MVGILAQRNQLGSFINSLGEYYTATKHRKDSTPRLVHRVTGIVQEEIHRNNGFAYGLLLWTDSYSIEVNGQLQREGFYTPARCNTLLKCMWEQRDIMLTALQRSPTPGLSAVLNIIRSNILEDPTMESKYDLNFSSIADRHSRDLQQNKRSTQPVTRPNCAILACRRT